MQPFLVARAKRRSGNTGLRGSYCPACDVWVVQSPEGYVPLVKTHKALAELGTTTKINGERNDPSEFAGTLLEFSTKTMTRRESDD
jgi:hypothetical protein